MAEVADPLSLAGRLSPARREGQLAAETLEHDLRRVLVRAALVLPLAGLELALDVNLGALLQVLLGDLAEVLVVDDDVVPLGAFLALAEALSRQDSDVAMRRLTTGAPEFSRRTSGSRPRLPTRMTLSTLPAMSLPLTCSALLATLPPRGEDGGKHTVIDSNELVLCMFSHRDAAVDSFLDWRKARG